MDSYNLRSNFSEALTAVLVGVITLYVCGCGDFFAHKPTELQTQIVLNELRQIEETQNIKKPLPEIYLAPAKRITVKDGVKLFYFTKHQTVDKLAELISNQFATKPIGTDGKREPIPGYEVSVNPAANQLVIQCSNDESADKVIEFLELVDVPPIQVNVNCLILERFADVTMDWETNIDIDNLLGERLTLGGKDGAEFPGASLRESKRSTFGLEFGYWNQKLEPHEFRAVVDVLVSRGYLRILMNPTVETINGKKAKVMLRDFAPLEMIVTKEGVEPYSLTQYEWVEDFLEVTPHVFSDGFIGLATKIQLGSKSKPEGVVQTSIITERSIEVAENRIEPGKSLIIGGIRKSEERAVVRGIPFFKDIPIIGILFSSKDFEEKATEVIFILTPSISSGGIEYAEMMEDMKQKRARPEYKRGLHEKLTDPFGSSAYTEYIEQEAAKAEFEKIKAELDKADAIEEVEIIKEKLLVAAEEVLEEKQKAAKAFKVAKKAKKEAEQLKAQMEKDWQVEKAKAEKAKAEAAAKKAKEKAAKIEKNAAESKQPAEKTK